MAGTHAATVERPLLLLVGSGMQTYREYLLRSISTRFDVHLFSGAEPGWERAYVAGWTVVPSTIDGPAMAATAAALHRDTPFAGVLCWDEGRIHATSYVAEALGLPNGDPAVVWRLRDKAQTRAALDAAGVAQPRSVPVRTVAEALAAAATVGYPAVLKPRGLGASLGVVTTRSRVAGIRFFYVDRDDTTVAAVSFDATALPAAIDRATVVVRSGAVVSPPPKGTVWGRIAYATAVADCVEECRRALDAAQAALSVTSAPTPSLLEESHA